VSWQSRQDLADLDDKPTAVRYELPEVASVGLVSTSVECLEGFLEAMAQPSEPGPDSRPLIGIAEQGKRREAGEPPGILQFGLDLAPGSSRTQLSAPYSFGKHSLDRGPAEPASLRLRLCSRTLARHAPAVAKVSCLDRTTPPPRRDSHQVTGCFLGSAEGLPIVQRLPELRSRPARGTLPQGGGRGHA
jgi:hypothetical protein